ncbi:hypothetical protein Tco_0911615 [Tanacetum coccineum]|uniref:Uncharacterized protein n=1 Tax=Tanacetum coccineum TaxID=301880 RepID=A0ABQ5CW78_9ASTR
MRGTKRLSRILLALGAKLSFQKLVAKIPTTSSPEKFASAQSAWSEEDDDDFYNDGSDCNLFMDKVNETQGGGGWIPNDVGNSKDISSPHCSKSDRILNKHPSDSVENRDLRPTLASRESYVKYVPIIPNPTVELSTQSPVYVMHVT